MFEFLGLIYAIGKDLIVSAHWKEAEKEVDRSWAERSGFIATVRDGGMNPRWVSKRKISSRELDGYFLVYEMDEEEKTLYKLYQGPEHDKLYLMAKKASDN